MNYLALYRRYRPSTFQELVGQDHVVRTLKNALAKNKVSHAYLFSGVRGTGKTSTAKILAKALNCLAPVDGEPCNQCANCLKINEGTFMDIIEIDAASNRGIDEIRDLREKIKFLPVEGRCKVYIIDEVHMLTGEAFNALLKTLEEPPGHIVFILATTEPHKIPMTILSRCQKFDFHKIPSELLMERLKMISDENGGQISLEALILITKLAGGGLRDGISLLDQCLTSFDDREIEAEDVAQIAGIVEDKKVAQLFRELAAGNTEEIISIYEELKESGKSIGQLIHDILEGFQNILIIKTIPKPDRFIPASEDVILEFKEIAGHFTKEQALGWVYALGEVEGKMKTSIHPDLLLEVELLRGHHQEAVEAPVQKAQPESKAAEPMKKPQPAPKAKVPVQKAVADTRTEAEAEAADIDGDKLWSRFMKTLDEKDKTIGAYYREVKSHLLEGRTLTVLFDPKYEFHRGRAATEANIKAAEEILKTIAGRTIHLKIESDAEGENKEKTPDDKIVDIFGDKVTFIKE